MVVGFLALQVGLGVVSVVLATNDQTWSVVPDYHRGAMAWDEQRAAQRASDELGWRHEVSVDPVVDGEGNRTLRVKLFDKSGEAIDADRVDATVFHHARGTNVRRCSLSRGAKPGTYEAGVPMLRPGLWEIRLSVERGNDRWLTTMQTELAESGS
jgi:nitrogen fixation protein FixH